MKYNIYKIDNCDFLGTVELNDEPDNLKENELLLIFEPLFENYNKDLFNTRFENGDKAWFIFLEYETLKPISELSYFINSGSQFVEVRPNVFKSISSENDIEFNDVLIDVPEHNTRATFFENLYKKYVDLEKLI